MKLTDQVTTDVPAQSLWEHLGDPTRWPGFNAKVGAARQTAGSAPGVDAWYDLEYRMGSRTLLHHARIAEFDPPRRLRVEATAPAVGSGPDVEVEILYEIESGPRSVRVRETVRVHNHGIPRPFVWLIQWIDRHGTAREPTALEQLRALLESESAHV